MRPTNRPDPPRATSVGGARRSWQGGLPLIAVLAAGCSLLPRRDWPEFEQRDVVAVYAPDGAPIEVPVSSDSLTVLSLEVDPPPVEEHWEQGRRLLVPAPGTSHVTVTCRYRAYLQDGQVARPEQLFPGASVRDVAP